MSQKYYHVCPYCGTQLSISHLPVEKTISRCPKCNKYILVDKFGLEIRKPNVYVCSSPHLGQT